MRADQENDFRVRVIRAGPIESYPQLIALARARRTDVRVRVVTVHTPGGENALSESIFAGPPDVIHDFVAPIFDDGLPDSRRDGIEHFVPTDTFPLSVAASPGTLEPVTDAVGVGYFIEQL